MRPRAMPRATPAPRDAVVPPTASCGRTHPPTSTLALGLALALAGACTKREITPGINGGPMTKMGSDRYVRKAIRSSNEGVILLPSEKAERVYELPRLTEIAHALRDPAALCFLSRAIETMEPAPDDERGFAGVPEGQVKIRVRIAPSGEVVRTEVLESGFKDESMPPCVQKAIERQVFPTNKGGVNHFVDVVYWVSLGMQADVHTEAYRQQLERERIAAGVRAKPCLQGRTPAGKYHIAALNLVNRDGLTMINRIDAQSLPEEVRSCVARAFRDLQMPRQPDAFVRPVLAAVDVEVGGGESGITVDGEEWLRLIELEERVRADDRARALRGGDDVEGSADASDGPVDLGPTPPTDDPGPSDDASPPEDAPPPKPDRPRGDPGKGGLKLDLGPR